MGGPAAPQQFNMGGFNAPPPSGPFLQSAGGAAPLTHLGMRPTPFGAKSAGGAAPLTPLGGQSGGFVPAHMRPPLAQPPRPAIGSQSPMMGK